MKVDAEGAEVSVLEGIKPDHYHLMQQIAVEVHTVPAIDRISEQLTSMGFQVLHDKGMSEIAGIMILYGVR